MSKGLRLIIVGVGGQGILTVSEILGRAALDEGLPAVMSEVHGMAQRGGVVTTELKLGDYRSPLIGNGEADIILGFEPVETYRILEKASPDTRIVTNVEPLVPPSVSVGQAKYPDIPGLLEKMRRSGLAVVAINAIELAKEAGDVRTGNMVMLGAAASVDTFILSREAMLSALAKEFSRGGPTVIKRNTRAFELGYAAGKSQGG